MSEIIVQLQWRSEGPPQEGKFDLRRTITIGRQPDNDIVLPDSKVSRTHALVFLKDGNLCLHNLSKINRIQVWQHDEAQTLGPEGQITLAENSSFQISGTVFQVVGYPQVTPQAAALTGDIRTICPTCGRSISNRLRDCPYDATSLAP